MFTVDVKQQQHNNNNNQGKLEEKILTLNGIKFQLALKVQLRKDNPDDDEEYTDPVLRHKQEALLQASKIKGNLDEAISHLLELDTEGVGVDGRPSADPLAGHRKISTIERELLHPTSSSRKVQEGSCQCEKQGRPLPPMDTPIGPVPSL